MIRFCLHPGSVVSVNDGERHHVGALQLAMLYGVKMSECVVVDPSRHDARPGLTEDLSRLLHLYPSTQGAAYWRISEAERQQYPLPAREGARHGVVQQSEQRDGFGGIA